MWAWSLCHSAGVDFASQIPSVPSSVLDQLGAGRSHDAGTSTRHVHARLYSHGMTMSGWAHKRCYVVMAFSVLYCRFLWVGSLYAHTFGEAGMDQECLPRYTALHRWNCFWDNAPKTHRALRKLVPAWCENGKNTNTNKMSLARYEVKKNYSHRFCLYILIFCQPS